MKYIAIIDYQHLDHSLFMKSFSEAMSRQIGCSGIILHGDSDYTERLIQTGTMRGDAVIRSTRDLNHRIVALLADSGVSGIGVNGYQKKIIQKSGEKLRIDNNWIEERPAGTHLVLSNLIWDNHAHKIAPFPLRTLADALSEQLNRDTVIIFPVDDSEDVLFAKKKSKIHALAENEINLQNKIPFELIPPPKNSYMSSTTAFGNLPDTSGMHRISNI